MLLYDALADPEAQASSLLTLGGKEGIENAAQIFPFDAAGIVANHDRDSPAMVASPAPILGLSNANRDARVGVVVESVKRIGNQIGYHLTHLPRKGLNHSVDVEIGLHRHFSIF